MVVSLTAPAQDRPTLDEAATLLVRAAAHPDLAVAARSWGRWLTKYGPPLASAGGDCAPRAESVLLPTVGWRLGDVVPSDAIAVATDARRQATQHNLALVAAFRRPLQTLADAGIRPVVLKGGALLSDAVLDDVGARWISDIDVLVAPEEATAALRLLAESGLERWPNDVPETIVRAVMHAAPVSGRSVNLDVHWTLLHHTQVAAQDVAMRKRAMPARLGPVAIIAPCRSDLLFHALAHGELPDLRWVVDAGILLDERIDVERVAAIAASRRYLKRVIANVETVRAALPTSSAERLAGALAKRRRRLGDTTHRSYGEGGPVRRTSAALGFTFNQLRDRPGDSVRFLRSFPLYVSHAGSLHDALRATRRIAR